MQLLTRIINVFLVSMLLFCGAVNSTAFGKVQLWEVCDLAMHADVAEEAESKGQEESFAESETEDAHHLLTNHSLRLFNSETYLTYSQSGLQNVYSRPVCLHTPPPQIG